MIDEVPEQIWWCFTCNGGVGVWGYDSNKPPPRCPDCKASNFAPVKFVPTSEPTESEIEAARWIGAARAILKHEAVAKALHPEHTPTILRLLREAEDWIE